MKPGAPTARPDQDIDFGLNAAVATCCSLSHTVEPDAERAAYYARRFEEYKAAVEAMQVFFRQT